MTPEPPAEVVFTYQGVEHRWPLIRLDGGGQPMTWAVWDAKCPKCGISMSLNSHVHTITPDGQTITPSLICPYGCGWHVWVKDGVASDT